MVGIKTSCAQKGKLYLVAETVKICTLSGAINAVVTLSKVIKEAKKCHYDNQLKNSANKNKTTWDIVNKETCRKANSTNIKFLSTYGITNDNQQLIVQTFNNYFISIAENIKTTDRNVYIQNQNTPDTVNIDTAPHYKKEMGKLKCTTFESKPATTTEIENIIKTLKSKNLYRYNEISAKLLKITAPFISSPLNYIM
jgi:hypothetical protein